MKWDKNGEGSMLAKVLEMELPRRERLLFLEIC